MKIYLEVTWPVRDTVRLSRSDPLDRLAKKLKEKKSDLRQDLVCFTKEELYIRGLFGDKNRVLDVDRYEIVRCGDKIAIKDHPVTCGEDYVSTYPYVDRPAKSNSGQAPRTLVIVLESPHRDEYGCSVAAPIAPARGKTGIRIDKLLITVLNSCPQLTKSLSDCAPVRVVISNPVPFQTSAYAIHRGRLKQKDWTPLRDAIWRALWDLKESNPEDSAQPCFVLQNNYRETLCGYNPIAVINACTSGLNSEVERFLHGLCITAPLYKAHHPSAWKCTTELTQISPLRSGTDSK